MTAAYNYSKFAIGERVWWQRQAYTVISREPFKNGYQYMLRGHDQWVDESELRPYHFDCLVRKAFGHCSHCEYGK